jgi:hypothetical protein
MKMKDALVAMILVFVLAGTLSGQASHQRKTRKVPRKYDLSSVLGKPVYQSSFDSLSTKVWIISQKKNKEVRKTPIGTMMDTKKAGRAKMDATTKEAMMAGTHCLIFDVRNIRNEQETSDTSAKVEIVSPTKKISSVNLLPMVNYFGGGVSLDEKGEYLLTINLDIGTDYRTLQLKYRVR